MKCGNCGAPLETRHYPENPDEGQNIAVTVTEWHCGRCGYHGGAASGHFARRLERVEVASVALLAALMGSGNMADIKRVAKEDGITARSLIVLVAADQIDALDAWAQQQGGAR